MKFFFWTQVKLAGKHLLWALGLISYGTFLTGGNKWWSTWFLFTIILLKRVESALLHSSAKLMCWLGKYCNFFSLDKIDSYLDLVVSSRKPHHIWEAYNIWANRVWLVISQSCTPAIPFDLRIFNAYMELAALLQLLSTCFLNDKVSSNSTPKIFILVTLWIPGVHGGTIRVLIGPCL